MPNANLVSSDIYKPGYEGERPSIKLSAPERQSFLQQKAVLVRMLHDAMLVLSVSPGADDLRIQSNAPTSICEFSDLIGREKEQSPPPKFRPTPEQISNTDAALSFLEGVTRAHFKVVYLRAIGEFGGGWTWEDIGGYFGMSDRWAESAYDAAMVQAARRAGMLPMTTKDHAILVASVWYDAMDRASRGWITCVTTSADPKQDLSNMRSKSPLKIAEAVAIWTNGKPLSQRIAKDGRRFLNNRALHGGWFRVGPQEVIDRMIQAARDIEAPWHLDEITSARDVA